MGVAIIDHSNVVWLNSKFSIIVIDINYMLVLLYVFSQEMRNLNVGYTYGIILPYDQNCNTRRA